MQLRQRSSWRSSPPTTRFPRGWTVVTWDRSDAFHAGVMTAARRAVTDICGTRVVTCRFTHVYPDGPAPWYERQRPPLFGQALSAVKRELDRCLSVSKCMSARRSGSLTLR